MTQSTSTRETPRMPVIFLAHGSPFLLDDETWIRELAAWSEKLPRPRSILMLSAHWVDDPITFGALRTVPLVYDFYGFPEKYYAVKYPAPGAPELATRIASVLEPNEPIQKSERGLDHGAYVPLVAMYPKADIPVLQVSLPSMEPKRLFAVGRALTPLRDEGVLIVGSGFITHNMSTFSLRKDPETPAWASDFDTWVKQALEKRDVDAMLDYRDRAPGVRMALPTHEHFVPLLVSMGAARDAKTAPTFPITGFMSGTFTKRSVEFA